jgi:hypothetical protein
MQISFWTGLKIQYIKRIISLCYLWLKNKGTWSRAGREINEKLSSINQTNISI